MTPEQYELRAESCDDMARWHEKQAEIERGKASRLRELAQHDREHIPSEEEQIYRTIRGV